MHSAPAAVTPDSESPPDQPGIRPDPPEPDSAPPRRSRRRIVIAAAAALGIALAAVFFAVNRSQAPGSSTSSLTTSANSSQILRLKGTTEAVQSRAILAPLLAGQSVPTLTIIHLTPAGTKVKKGDLLVEFDRQAQMRDFVDKQADYSKLVD